MFLFDPFNNPDFRHEISDRGDPQLEKPVLDQQSVILSEMKVRIAKLLKLELKDKIDTVLKTLTYREREIIKLRYGLGDGYTYTLEEVGRIFKVTRERVRQIEAKAVRKLQHPVRSKQLKGFLDSLMANAAN